MLGRGGYHHVHQPSVLHRQAPGQAQVNLGRVRDPDHLVGTGSVFKARSRCARCTIPVELLVYMIYLSQKVKGISVTAI